MLCVARLTNEGLAAARNHALDHVDTEWIARSLYFPSSEIGRSPPLFRLRSVWPQIRLMLQFLARRPHAFYLPALILGAMLYGAFAGRKEVSRRVIGVIDHCRA